MDLHVHTCLSPCADDAMTPPTIAAWALRAGLQAIGICDHNAGGNAAAVQKAGQEQGIAVLAGMEVTTREEIHLLVLFAGVDELEALERELAPLMRGTNDPRYFGEQILADHRGNPLGRDERFLLGACDLGVDELVARTHSLGGIVVASHIDKPVFSILSQLGFIPEGLALDAVEVSPHCPSPAAFRGWGLPILRGSDAHYPEQIGTSHTRVLAEAASLAELRWALEGRGGRAVIG